MNILNPSASSIRSAITLFGLKGHVFFVDKEAGKLEVFSESTCSCGQLCRDGNGVAFVGTKPEALLALGFKESQTTNEGSVTEDGEDCCEACYKAVAG